jgi:predicted RNase H-like HicB family nuclease
MTTTHHEYRGYVFCITYRDRQRGYIVDFPDFPDLMAIGCTLPQAFAHACKGLDLLLHSLRNLKMPQPQPKYRLILESPLPACWLPALSRATDN